MNKKVLDCSLLANNLIEKLKDKSNNNLTLAIISFNDSIYKKSLKKYCDILKINLIDYRIDNPTTSKILSIIDNLNKDNSVNGIVIEEPINNSIDKYKCYNAIDISKDIDGVNFINQYYLSINKPKLINSVIVAIDKIFNFYNISLESKNITIIGRSYNISKPLFNHLINKNATVMMTHSKTNNLKALLTNSDIIISITGKKHLIKTSDLKDDSIFIDVGLHDLLVDSNNIYYTPSINGVGIISILALLENLIYCNLEH